MNLEISLCYVSFNDCYGYLKYHQYQYILINRKNLYTSFYPVFCMLSFGKSSDILSWHNDYGFTSEVFALNWYIFTALTNKKLLTPL